MQTGQAYAAPQTSAGARALRSTRSKRPAKQMRQPPPSPVRAAKAVRTSSPIYTFASRRAPPMLSHLFPVLCNGRTTRRTDRRQRPDDHHPSCTVSSVPRPHSR
ncbi:hypothetical protein C8Q77DRAFT_1095491 [Trametes polyzona]|nr:hypothetical protein C8Q77DRAFT_1095491 [Trametes polyzona]